MFLLDKRKVFNDIIYAIFMKSTLRNVSREDLHLVEEAVMAEGIISTAESERPILATASLVNCVSLAGYSNQLKRGFITHSTDVRELVDNPRSRPLELKFDKSLKFLRYWATIGCSGRANYDLIIATGDIGDPSYGERYVEEMNHLYGDSINFNVVGIDFSKGGYGNNLAIDLRTGERLNYLLVNPAIEDTERSYGSTFLKWRVDDSLRKLEK
jgi:hypothetical protein